MYAIIGDPHLGFKAYDSTRRTEEVLQTFELAVDMCYSAGCKTVYVPGDLTDDTVLANWVEKRTLKTFRLHPDVKFIILGGNHDSTKTYSSVSALDVMAEHSNVVVLNDFEAREFTVDDLKILAVPHTRSQKAFLAIIDGAIAAGTRYDMAMLHCMVDSRLDLGPNDLNIDTARLTALSKLCTNVWIGHQHLPENPLYNVWIPGSTVELNFGELGARYVYVVKEGVPARLRIPQPREMVRTVIEWTGIGPLLDQLADLKADVIYKFSVSGIPSTEYSSAAAAMTAAEASFEGDMVYELLRTDHQPLVISTIDASFDLVTEFQAYCKDNGVDGDRLVDTLTDAVAEVAAEEEDLTL